MSHWPPMNQSLLFSSHFLINQSYCNTEGEQNWWCCRKRSAKSFISHRLHKEVFSSLSSPEGLAFNCLSMASITVWRSVNIWIINVFSMAILGRIPVTDHYEMQVCKQCLRVQTSVDIVLEPTKKLNLTVIQKVNLDLKIYSVLPSHWHRASVTLCQQFN